MKSKRLLILLLFALLAPWAANAQVQVQKTTTCYPPTQTYATGYCDQTTKTSGDMHAVSNGGEQGWMKFDVSSIPDDATIDAITLKFYCKSTSNCWVKLTSAGELDPATATASDLYAAITNTDPNYYTSDHMSGFSTTGWKTFALSAAAKTNLQANGLANDYFTLGFYEYESGDYYLYAAGYNDEDNKPYIEVTYTATVSCPQPTLSQEVTTTTTSATVSWTPGNEGQQLFDLYWSTENTTPAETATPLAANLSGTSYTINGLTAATRYYVWIRGNCGTATNPDVSGGWASPINFTTDCEAINVGYTCGFEGPNTGGTTSYPLPVCWTRITGQSTPYPYAYNYSYNANNGSYSLYFYSGSSSSSASATEIAIMPEISGDVNGKRLSFYQKGAYSFSVGYMTDPEDEATFVSVLTKTGTSSYAYFDVDFSGCPNDAKFIAIKSNFTSAYQAMYFDDFTLSLTPSCMDPTMNATATNIGTNAATVSWTAGGANQLHWDVYYNKTGVAPTDETTPQIVYTDQNPLEITGLDASSMYYVWVRGNCGTQADPDYSPWSTTYCQLVTDCEAVTIFPWNETFENYNSGTFNAPCWVNAHISGSGTSLFSVYSYSNGGNTTHQLQLPDMYSGTLTKLRLPEMTLPSNDYQFVIDVYRNATGTSYTTEGIRVYVSTNGEIEGATELAFISRNCSVANGAYIPAESASGWYTYELPLGISGTCYIILRGESQYGSATYMDNFAVEQIPPCTRPSALSCTTKTAHTATLQWTNGSEDQTAWQIAYCTAATFSPDTVTKVDVTTNPATIEGLAANTQYYAYVRANCGTDGYSSWSRKTGNFKTATGKTAPSGLVAEVTNYHTATVSWKPVATNDYHEFYELYISQVNTLPETLAQDSLITPINDTVYEFINLQAEKTYYVWVRDSCGTDGLSAWSSRISFNTPAQCQTPDGLEALNVTINSAVINWNTYEQTGFNLRYREEGGSWNDRTDVTPGCELTGLTENTPYEVLVQVQCNLEKWSDTLRFRTECDVKTITEEHFYTEDFEAPVVTSVYNSSTGLEMPYCWDNGYVGEGTAAYLYPHLITAGASYNYAESGQVLYFYGTGNDFAVLPEFTNALNTLQIDFKYATEGTVGTLTLGYITAEDVNFNTFDTIAYFPATSASDDKLIQAPTVYLNKVPATATRLVFRWDYSGWYGCNIDDVVVKLGPSCFPLGTLAYSDVTNHTVKLSWTLVDDTQTAWQVCLNDDETDLRDVLLADATVSNDTVTYVLTGLDAESRYSIKVRANCGSENYSEWSNVVELVTEIACPAPIITGIVPTPNSADVTLTSDADTYDIEWAEIAEGGDTLWMLYDDGSLSTNYGTPTASTQTWGVMYPASLREGKDMLTKIAFYEGYYADSFEGDIIVNMYSGGTSAPGTLVGTETVTPYGSMGWHEVTLTSPVFINSEENLWITLTGTGTYIVPMSSVNEANGRWILNNGDWVDIGTLNSNLANRTFMIRGYVETGFDPDALTWTTRTEVTSPYTINGLEDESRYAVRVKANCGGIDGQSAYTYGLFTTPSNCAVPTIEDVTNIGTDEATLSWTGYQESYNVQYRTSMYNDMLFQDYFADGELGEWTVSGLYTGQYQGTTFSSSVYEGLFQFFTYGATDPQYLISPELTGIVNGSTLSFEYEAYNETLQIGFSSTTADTDQFTWNPEMTLTISDDGYYECEIPEGTKYFAIKCTSAGTECLYLNVSYFYVFGPAGEWSNLRAVTSPQTITDLSDGTIYEWHVQGINASCDGGATDWTETYYFITVSACATPVADSVNNISYTSATLYWTGVQDEYNVRYRTAGRSPLNEGFETYENNTQLQEVWTFISKNTANGIGGTGSYPAGLNAGAAHEGTKGFQFSSYTSASDYNQYLVSPELRMSGNLTFYYRNGSTFGSGESFRVGYSTTTADVETPGVFTWTSVTTCTSTTWAQYPALTLPDDVKYIAINYCSSYEYYFYVDDITIVAEPVPAGEWVYENNVTSPLALSAFTAGTEYEWQVQGIHEGCNEGDTTAWSQSKYFETLPLPTQTIQLAAGYNWFSTNLNITQTQLEAALAAALPDATTANPVKVSGQNGKARTFNGSSWRGSGFVWDVAQMYIIQAPSACELTVEGLPLNPAEHSINIMSGYNWIGFPLSETMSVANAFAGFDAVANDKITAQNGDSKTYNGTTWRVGKLNNLDPGQGYLFNSASSTSRTLVFPSSTRQTVQPRSMQYPTFNFQMPQVIKKKNVSAPKNGLESPFTSRANIEIEK